MNFDFKQRYDINDLVSIMSLLRSPEGCAWDRAQDHFSIRRNLIEETYEVLDAINNKDTENLREELGDLLLQVVFHCCMEQEQGSFDFADVTNDICQKLVVRHPHVFGDITAGTTDEALKSWDTVKAATKGQKKASESMASIPSGFPALLRAEKIQKKASGAGFDWPDGDGALAKLSEECQEMSDAIESGDKAAIEDELGDVLFSVVNVSRFVNTDPEAALNAACDKFLRRFTICEKLAQERGIDMKASSIEELDKLWDEAKAALAQ